MKIIYGEVAKYYDRNGNEIKAGDYILMDGAKQKVYLTEDGYLGIDATNPAWIKRGWACECEYGVYQFNEFDDPVLLKGEGVDEN